MVKEKLEVFARIKPSDSSQTTILPYLESPKTITLDVQRTKLSNARDQQEFNFNQVFSQSGQEDIFENVARPVIDNGLDGYNGTIFAYGQTGSGKTYTISGGDKWEERGIIPRVLEYVFEEFDRRSGIFQYTLTVSFIQIYNQNAYDLLKEEHSTLNFENWSKIVFMEDQDCNLQMKNVEAHTCGSQEEGIDFLMMGNYIRKINSTSLNQASSRSHCIFTLNIKGKNLSTLAEVYSKIHLVDLAGSQRVSKSQAEGLILTEAKSINLSLTYLEQVIVALNQKAKSKNKQHIPYRNSLLTTLLKDSLGGNCKTVMIATISMQSTNLEETISTLRFSQRVKQIQNQIQKNEKNIYSTQIEGLQKENKMLKRKLAKFEKENQRSSVEQRNYDQDQELKNKIDEFMMKKKNTLDVGNVHEAQFCFMKMRELYNRKMRQYATQLTFISEKLQKYDQILSKREKGKRDRIDMNLDQRRY